MAETELCSQGGHIEVYHSGQAKKQFILSRPSLKQASTQCELVLTILGTSQLLPQVGSQLRDILPNSLDFSPPNRDMAMGPTYV